MEISEQTLEFIKDHQNDLDTENWENIYKTDGWRTNYKVFGQITQLAYEFGSDPLEHLDYIPEGFLFGAEIPSFDIPSHIKSIGDSAFQYCKNLIKISIPNSVTTIGELAFDGCDSLESVECGQNTQKIGRQAFTGCKKLKDVKLTDSVQEIQDRAFQNCGMDKITIPKGVTLLDDYVFQDCGQLSTVVFEKIPDTVKSPFYKCNGILNVYVPDLWSWMNAGWSTASGSPTSNGADLYVGGKLLTDLVVPFNGDIEVPFGSFWGCKSIKKVKISDGIQTLKKSCFCRCDMMEEVTIPESVTSIEPFAFCDCSNLKKIIYEGTLEQWDDIELERGWRHRTKQAITLQCSDFKRELIYQ